MMIARMVVASGLSTPRTPIFPKMATTPAKKADSAA
jgi:hypothetical protein